MKNKSSSLIPGSDSIKKDPTSCIPDCACETVSHDMNCPCKGNNLDKMLQPSILLCLAREDLHGFLLIQKLAMTPLFHGEVPDKAGVYRYLKKMEESGMLQSHWEMDTEGNKPRKIFSITERGRECLITWYVALQEYSANIEELTANIGLSLGLSNHIQ